MQRIVQRILDDYGMIFVLLALCVLFSLLTLSEQVPSQGAAVEQLVALVRDHCRPREVVVVAGAAKRETGAIARQVGKVLRETGYGNVEVVVGTPRDLRQALDRISAVTRVPSW